MMMMMMYQKVASNRLKIEYVVVWGKGIDILVHQIFAQKSYGFNSHLKSDFFSDKKSLNSL